MTKKRVTTLMEVFLHPEHPTDFEQAFQQFHGQLFIEPQQDPDFPEGAQVPAIMDFVERVSELAWYFGGLHMIGIMRNQKKAGYEASDFWKDTHEVEERAALLLSYVKTFEAEFVRTRGEGEELH